MEIYWMDQKDDMGGITIPTVTDDETSEPEALIGVCEFQSSIFNQKV